MISLKQQKLFIVYNQAVAKARKSEDRAKIIQRLHSALGIIQSLDYYRDEKALYSPTYYSCNCADWKYHLASKRDYKGHCKHMMAEILIDRMNGLKFKQLDFFKLVGG